MSFIFCFFLYFISPAHAHSPCPMQEIFGRSLVSKIAEGSAALTLQKTYEDRVLAKFKMEVPEWKRREAMGDRHVEILKELGFSLVQVSGKSDTIRPPKNILDLFSRAYQMIDQQISEGAISRENAIYPAVRYRDPRSNRVRMFRPGRDPLPSEQWLIAEKEQVSVEVWGAAVADGLGMVMIDAAYFEHDWAHITGFIEDPKKAAALRKMYRQLVSGALRPQGQHFLSNKGMPFRADRLLGYRMGMVDEFFSLPRLSRREEIETAFSRLFVNAPTIESEIAYFRGLLARNPAQLNAELEDFFKKTEGFLIRGGAQLRDFYNFNRYHDTFLSAAYDTQHAALRRAKSLFAYFCENKFTSDIVLESLLSDVAEIELALYAGIKFNITAEKVIEESILSAPHTNSDTYRYFKAFSRPGSPNYLAFVESAEK